jgi:hypothetical protein
VRAQPRPHTRLMRRPHRPASPTPSRCARMLAWGNPQGGKTPLPSGATPPGALPTIEEQPRRPFCLRARSSSVEASLPLRRPRPSAYTPGPSPCWPLTNRIVVFAIPLFYHREGEERRRRRGKKKEGVSPPRRAERTRGHP